MYPKQKRPIPQEWGNGTTTATIKMSICSCGKSKSPTHHKCPECYGEYKAKFLTRCGCGGMREKDFPQCNKCRGVQQDLRGLTSKQFARFMDALSDGVSGLHGLSLGQKLWILELEDKHRANEGKRPRRGEILLLMCREEERNLLLWGMSEEQRGEALVAMPVEATARLMQSMELETAMKAMGWMPKSERSEVLISMEPEESAPIMKSATWMSEEEKDAVRRASVLMRIVEGEDDRALELLGRTTPDESADTMTSLMSMGCEDRAIHLLKKMSKDLRVDSMLRMKCSCQRQLYASVASSEEALLRPSSSLSGMCAECVSDINSQVLLDTLPIAL